MREVIQSPAATARLRFAAPEPASSSVTIVDLKARREASHHVGSTRRVLRNTFEEGGRAILFLNRRGEFTQVTCRLRKHPMCPNAASLSRTTQRTSGCATVWPGGQRRKSAPTAGTDWYFAGFGIERAERSSKPSRPFRSFGWTRSKKDEAPSLLVSRWVASRDACLQRRQCCASIPCLKWNSWECCLGHNTESPGLPSVGKAFTFSAPCLRWWTAAVPGPDSCQIQPDNAGVKGIQDQAFTIRR